MKRKQYINLPDHARRDFIKWTVGLGAALGLRPWKVFEIQESIVGPAVADSASCSSVNRFVGLVCGNGGHSWNTQLWPHIGQASVASAAFYAPGKAVAQAATGAGDHPMSVAPDAPKFAGKRITGIVCGTNETHTQKPLTAITVAAGISMFAAAAALQTASPTLVPAIQIGALPFGTAAGAPAVASVANSAGLVDLFNSASSTAGGALANASDAALFEAYYKANLSLHSAAARPTMTSGLTTGKVAANLIGKNLASQLMPTAADLARYGITAQTAAKLSSIGTALITTAKAFALNLTSHVLLPAFNDDPHTAFQNMTTLTQTVQQYGKILDAFMADCMLVDDPMCAGRKIGDNLVMAWNGDTTKNCLTPSGWPDGTASNHNVLYVLGNGFTKAGWFGGVQADGSLSTWSPPTGAQTALTAAGAMTSANLAGPASASVLFAVAKGDMRRVQDFYRGPDISGITNATNM
ncbi:MAG TPA: hypothetical protein VIA18_15610 [Polyangia bacterium]|jgi:hypothetical protein|nr:hypothetical protein [Polyangia bacterium]HWE30507.1 hypothetical protein [Polyangia bacterium]